MTIMKVAQNFAIKLILLLPLISSCFLSGCQSVQQIPTDRQLHTNNSAAFHQEMALVDWYWQQQQYRLVKTHLLEALTLAPDSIDVQALLALNASDLKQQLSSKHWTRAIAFSDIPWARAVKAILLCRRQQFNQANRVINTLAGAHTSAMPWMIWQGLAQCQCQDKIDKACAYSWRQVLLLRPKDTEAILHLVAIELKLKQADNAAQGMHRFYNLSPPTFQSLQLEQKIAAMQGHQSSVASLIVLQNALSSSNRFSPAGGTHESS